MRTDATKMKQIKGRLSRKAVGQIAELANVSKSTVYSVLSGKRQNFSVCDAILVVLEEEVSRNREFEEKTNSLLTY